jgi:hypothetical protein
MMKGLRPGRHYYSSLFLGHLKFSMFHAQFSRKRKGELRLAGLKRLLRKNKYISVHRYVPLPPGFPFPSLLTFQLYYPIVIMIKWPLAGDILYEVLELFLYRQAVIRQVVVELPVHGSNALLHYPGVRTPVLFQCVYM